jgi:glutamate racemase
MGNIIGVFDSGVGGLAIVQAVEQAFPGARVIYSEDSDNLPYGTKTPAQLLPLVLPKLQGLVDQGCQAIVIACNTVTTTLIEELRRQLQVPLVGMEPMIKPAADSTKSRVIAVCATPTTLASARYGWLKHEYAPDITVLEPDCSDWARMIESDQVDRQATTERIEAVCRQGADVIVLGCTHYHWIEELIKSVARERALVIQPEEPVLRQLRQVLGQTA